LQNLEFLHGFEPQFSFLDGMPLLLASGGGAGESHMGFDLI
jgi:hypothetical protein